MRPLATRFSVCVYLYLMTMATMNTRMLFKAVASASLAARVLPNEQFERATKISQLIS